MKKTFKRIVAVIGIVGCLVTNVGAIGEDLSYSAPAAETISITRATGSFSVEVKPYERAKGDTNLPMEAGETVRIRATYSPEDASVDFGLVDPDGIFHYLSAEDGVFDKTFEIPARGNYRLGIKNNSNVAVQASGFVRY